MGALSSLRDAGPAPDLNVRREARARRIWTLTATTVASTVAAMPDLIAGKDRVVTDIIRAPSENGESGQGTLMTSPRDG
jgi:hypothetical protein